MCAFVYGTMSLVKSPLHWLVIHYQMTFLAWFGNVYCKVHTGKFV